MYLKCLEMLGFKSFASRTLLEFSQGITAVVGPNGAGKSNIADSLRWVLGEQSMRQLRGKKSDDIIFVGGHSRAALGMAEVSLTLDNSTGWIPYEYSEITVTRRSYRSGENEYLINRQKARLRDVRLLLSQARIGHDSYTVVGQGLIDAALSLRAEERRGLLEDAAGIRPFQEQRADAEHRLHQTEQNLDRLRDIVSEIEPRLAPLAEQARRAIEIGQLNRELQDLLIAWYRLQWRRLQTTNHRAELAEQEQAQKVRRLEAALLEQDKQANTLRTMRQQTQLLLGERRKAHGEANDWVRSIERDLAVDQERAISLEQQRSDIQQEERRLRERLIVLQRQTIDLEEQCDLADEMVDTGSADLAGLEAQVTKAQKDYEMDERRLRATQHDLIQIQTRLVASQTEVGRLQKQLGERNRMLAARRDTLAKVQQSLEMLETRLVEERARLSTANHEEQQILQQKQAIAQALTDAQQQIGQLKATLAEAEQRRRTISDRLSMLKNWRQNLSGYSDGVRALLRAPVGKLSGLIGPVPQLMIAPDGMEAALEAALGPYMQAVVVQKLDDAQRCLSYLQSTQAGKAMIVWMEREGEAEAGEVSLIQEQVEEAVLQRFLAQTPSLRERTIGFAWQHLQCDQRYRSLFSRMLHGMVIVLDLGAAHKLLAWAIPLSLSSGNDLPFEAIVTLRGEVLHVNGWLTGGGKGDVQQGLLAYERELRTLPEQMEEQKVHTEQLNKTLSDVLQVQEGWRREQTTLEKELQRKTSQINELNKGIAMLQREQERSQTEIQLAASIEQQLVSEVAGLAQEVVSVQERVHLHEKSQHEMASLLEELQQEIEERAIDSRRQQEEFGQARTALAVKRQEAKSLHQQLATQQTMAQDLKVQVEQQITRGKEAEQRQQTLQESLVQYRGQLEKAQSQVRLLVNELRLAEEQLGKIDQQMITLEQHRTHIRQDMTTQETAYRRSLLDSQKAHDAVDSLLGQLREEMGITDPKDLVSDVTHTDGIGETTRAHTSGQGTLSDNAEELSEEEEVQLRQYRRRIDNLRSRLKTMGGCDINAPQQYEEIRTRFEFLSTQIADMDQAAHHLRTIIGQLDATMARQFEATFHTVNARFREHFTTLFNGGTAHLELVTSRNREDDSTPSGVPTGVEVIVQPPGKRVQDLALLSGGERALVSAALLFSLLEISPPPFCLLDEVDAALDESNVTRFCDILKQLAQRTQFIVITHNRVTMTAAQVLYGVSMRESVSRLLSLRLEEIAIAGEG